METMLSDFYLARVHCLGIMNKNSKCTKNMPGISGGERARKDIALDITIVLVSINSSVFAHSGTTS